MNYMRELSNALFSRIIPYVGKFLGVNTVDFNIREQPVIIFSEFMRYWKSKGLINGLYSGSMNLKKSN